jgi:hypothetical protein
MKHTKNNNHGDYTDFLTAIRTFECSIDPCNPIITINIMTMIKQ